MTIPTASRAGAYVADAASHQVLEWLGGSTMQVLLDSEHSGGALAVVRATMPDGANAPLHVHSREDEIFILLTGSAVIWAGDDRFELAAGGVAHLPRDIPHTYRITSPATDVLTICTPGGMDAFFRGVGHDVATPRPQGWEITPASMGAAAAAGGVQILGPPKGAED